METRLPFHQFESHSLLFLRRNTHLRGTRKNLCVELRKRPDFWRAGRREYSRHCEVVDSFRCPSPRGTTLVRRWDAPGDVLVSLTQTKSRGKEHKDDVVNKIREAVDAFKYIYVLEFDNMRTNAFKDLRGQLSDCRSVVLRVCHSVDSSLARIE